MYCIVHTCGEIAKKSVTGRAALDQIALYAGFPWCCTDYLGICKYKKSQLDRDLGEGGWFSIIWNRHRYFHESPLWRRKTCLDWKCLICLEVKKTKGVGMGGEKQ